MGSDPMTQPKDRILDLYGAFGREAGGWIAIAHVIGLLGHVGVDEQAVRSAASRMKRNGLLVAEKRAGAAGYALSKTAMSVLEDGDARIFASRSSAPDDWLIAVFSVPEAERNVRYVIRSRLADLGFGQASAAVWIAPGALLRETEHLIERHDLAQYVTLWRGAYAGFGDIATVVADAWDLPCIVAEYRSYLATAEVIAARWRAHTRQDRVAFVDYLDNLAQWRPLPYHDPGLPDALVPEGWPAAEARELFHRLDDELRAPAQRFFTDVVQA